MRIFLKLAYNHKLKSNIFIQFKMMEYKNETKSVKKLILCHNFSQDITTVWNLIKDIKSTFSASNSVRTDAIFKKGQQSFEIGSEFSYSFKNFYQFNIEVKEVTEKDHYRKLVWLVEPEPNLGMYDYIYELFYISVDKSCFLKWTIDFHLETRLNKPILEKIQQERQNIINLFDSYLKQNTIKNKVTQIESTLVTGPAEPIFKLISSEKFLKKFENISKEESGQIITQINENKGDKGDYFTNDKNLQLPLLYKVINSEYIKNEEKLILKVEYTFGEISLLPYEVLFELFKLESRCFFKITHFFNENIDSKILEWISKKKRKALRCIMNKFGSKN